MKTLLRIIKSGFYSGGQKRIFDEISSLAKSSANSLLIVPEQQTVMTEGEASKALAPSDARFFEVTNFTRLANTTFRTLGGLAGEYCDKAKSSLIMWKALTELSPLLTLTSGRRDINAGLVENARLAVSEMQSLGIHPAELADTA